MEIAWHCINTKARYTGFKKAQFWLLHDSEERHQPFAWHWCRLFGPIEVAKECLTFLPLPCLLVPASSETGFSPQSAWRLTQPWSSSSWFAACGCCSPLELSLSGIYQQHATWFFELAFGQPTFRSGYWQELRSAPTVRSRYSSFSRLFDFPRLFLISIEYAWTRSFFRPMCLPRRVILRFCPQIFAVGVLVCRWSVCSTFLCKFARKHYRFRYLSMGS